MEQKLIDKNLGEFLETGDKKLILRLVNPNVNLIRNIIDSLINKHTFHTGPEEVLDIYKLLPNFITKKNINSDKFILFKLLDTIYYEYENLQDADDNVAADVARQSITALKTLINKTIDLGVDLNIRNKKKYERY